MLDFLGHLADMESSPDLDYQCWGSGSEAQTIREAIDEHVPEVQRVIGVLLLVSW